jgi:ankyrin repeat protein
VRWILEHGGDTSQCSHNSWEWIRTNGHLNLFLSSASKFPWIVWFVLYEVRNDVGTVISHSQLLSKVNEQDAEGNTALHYASRGLNYPDNIFRWLVEEFNADFNILNKDGMTPISLLNLYMMDDEFFVWLVTKLGIESLGNPLEPVLHQVAHYRNRKLIDWLVHVKKADLNQVDSHGRTALLVYLSAAAIGIGQNIKDNEVCRWLAGDGKSLTQNVSSFASGPLFLYLQHDKAELDVIKEWIDVKGADITAVDLEGVTVLGNAIQAGRLDFVKWFVEAKGEAITRVNRLGDSALILASREGRTEIVKWLLKEKGADVKAVNGVGQTALHVVRHVTTAKLLLENGANIDSVDDNGESPFDTALRMEKSRLAVWLASLKEA